MTNNYTQQYSKTAVVLALINLNQSKHRTMPKKATHAAELLLQKDSHEDDVIERDVSGP